MPVVKIYADGSSHARGSLPGGWAFVCVYFSTPNKFDIVGFGYGGDPSTTNNLMELTAAIRGIQAFTKFAALQSQEWRDRTRAVLISDSQYTLGVASGRNRILSNVILATELRGLAVQYNVATRWVRGHTGDPWNERCDRFAKKGKEEALKSLEGATL